MKPTPPTNLSGTITIQGNDGEVWTITQSPDNGRFYIESTKGYSNKSGSGFALHYAIDFVYTRINNPHKFTEF